MSTRYVCDVVRLSKELVGHRSIWRRPKYLRLCWNLFTTNWCT